MNIISAGASGLNVMKAASKAAQELDGQLDREPSLLITYHTAMVDSGVLVDYLAALYPECRIVACSSCLGLMTQTGLHGFESAGVSLWSVEDADGAYGTGFSNLDQGAEAAARSALHDALTDVDRAGEMPGLVWVHSSPGSEEAVVSVIDDYFGGHVPVVGGSAADNAIEGEWTVAAAGRVGVNAVTVTVMFPSVAVSTSFQSGYVPTEHSGIVTSASGRVIECIDGRPAVDVYNEWSGGLITDVADTGQNILGTTTLNPLGREVGQIESAVNDRNLPYYSLLHPERVTATGGLSLFAAVREGEEIYLMTGSAESLVDRAAQVASDSLRLLKEEQESVSGGLMIYCAGCMLRVRDSLEDVIDGVNTVLSGAPLAGAFTFGEQGCFAGGENRHGNLMVSMVLFGGGNE